jgi:hypothetical protein
MPVRALVSKSSTVKLFTIKYLSFGPETSEVPSSVADPYSVACAPDGASVVGVVGEDEVAGPVGTLDAPVAVLRRNRHTRRTPWNRESWNLVIAAAQLLSVL